mmetsp:Transcript_2439/g.8236  ORF Transcript_2439/g.8236 Transcript_2439/m.8236 type:complete len:203 (-) Transcript_2439:8-616(-)
MKLDLNPVMYVLSRSLPSPFDADHSPVVTSSYFLCRLSLRHMVDFSESDVNRAHSSCTGRSTIRSSTTPPFLSSGHAPLASCPPAERGACTPRFPALAPSGEVATLPASASPGPDISSFLPDRPAPYDDIVEDFFVSSFSGLAEGVVRLLATFMSDVVPGRIIHARSLVPGRSSANTLCPPSSEALRSFFQKTLDRLRAMLF